MPWPRAFRPVHSLLNPLARRVAGRFGSLVELKSKYDPADLLHGNARVVPAG